jgi:hypothetical protein
MGSSTSSFNCHLDITSSNFLKWDFSSFNQLVIRRPFRGLEFAAHSTSHFENDPMTVRFQGSNPSANNALPLSAGPERYATASVAFHLRKIEIRVIFSH